MGAVAEHRVQRRLAAILAADVVGYSALLQRAEEATYTEFCAYCHAPAAGRLTEVNPAHPALTQPTTEAVLPYHLRIPGFQRLNHRRHLLPLVPPGR